MNYPNIKIILGGIHATIMYEQIIRKYPYVIVIRGEGEITFAELISSTDITQVKGIAYWNNDLNEVIVSPDRELIAELDTLPFPKHEVIFEDYSVVKTSASLISSRGCYASCSFCVLNPTSKRRVRFRSAKNVVDEIEYLSKKYPQLTKIFFQDDSFTSNNTRVIELCNEIISRKLNYIEYTCCARIKPFRKEMISSLEKANFKVLCFGFETGCDTLLERCQKDIRMSDIITTVKLFKNSIIEPVLFLIVGLPGENKQTIKRTIDVIRYMQRNIRWLYFQDASIISVYPGTRIYEDMKATGQIDDPYWLTDAPTPIYSVDHGLDTLLQYKQNLLDQVTIYPLSIKRVLFQFPNSYNILRYVLRKLYAKRRRIRLNNRYEINPVLILLYRFSIMSLKVSSSLKWYLRQLV